MLALVAAGYGVGFSSAAHLEVCHHKDVVVRPLDDPSFMLTTFLLRPDNKPSEQLSNFNPLMGLNNAFSDMLLNFVMATMFIVLPTFWMIAISWAGIRTGNFLQGLASGSADAKSVGGKGIGLAQKAVKK